MVGECIDLLMTCISAVVGWTTTLFNAMDANGYLVAVFILVLIVSLIIIPMRGGRSIDTSFADYGSGSIRGGRSNEKAVSEMRGYLRGSKSGYKDARGKWHNWS